MSDAQKSNPADPAISKDRMSADKRAEIAFDECFSPEKLSRDYSIVVIGAAIEAAVHAERMRVLALIDGARDAYVARLSDERQAESRHVNEMIVGALDGLRPCLDSDHLPRKAAS